MTTVDLEVVHLLLHGLQFATVLAILYYLVRTYRSIRSKFNLALVVFAFAVLLEIVFAIALELAIHILSETFLLAALAIFLYSIRK